MKRLFNFLIITLLIISGLLTYLLINPTNVESTEPLINKTIVPNLVKVPAPTYVSSLIRDTNYFITSKYSLIDNGSITNLVRGVRGGNIITIYEGELNNTLLSDLECMNDYNKSLINLTNTLTLNCGDLITKLSINGHSYQLSNACFSDKLLINVELLTCKGLRDQYVLINDDRFFYVLHFNNPSVNAEEVAQLIILNQGILNKRV